jgi:hypothetical protein
MEFKCYCVKPSTSPGQECCARCGGSPAPPSLNARMNLFLGKHPIAGILIGVLGIGVIFLVMASSGPTEDETPVRKATPVLADVAPPTATSVPPARSLKPLSDDLAFVITSGISGYPEVLDATIRQDDDKLSLVLIVGYQTSEARAMELGDNFVRMAKSILNDSPPDKRIGRGKYNYLIGVYYSDEKLVAMGAKVSGADRLSW